jgi:heme o synthase
LQTALPRDYLSLTKPRIIVLLDLVAVSAFIVANSRNVSLSGLLALLVAGTLASGGSGALNSYLDRDIDQSMRRTRKRPIPSGRIVPELHALYFGLALSLLGFLVAAYFLNYVAAFFVGFGAIFYVVVYTLLLKRRTSLNIVIGGFAGSCAVLAGWTAVTHSLAFPSLLPGLLMGLLVFLWTPSHFWSLAIRGSDDYASVGIPMLPVVVGERRAMTYIFVSSVLIVAFSIALWAPLGVFGTLYLVIVAIMGGLLLLSNIRMIRRPSKETAWTAFKFSSPYLAVVFVGMVLDVLFRV